MTCFYSLILITIFYMSLSVVTSYEFGSSLKHSVLDSIDEQTKLDSSLLIRCAYLVGLVCHIPFMFFSAKESFLVIVAETWDKTLSRKI
jgi:hypothetical protein